MAAPTAHQTHSRPLEGRVAIVTGSSRGIGRAIALHLASLGAKLVVNYTSASSAAEADAVAAQINSSSPGSAIVVRADVSEPSQVQSLFDAAEQAFASPVHILVNSAGVANPSRSSIAETSIETFDRIFSVNARGAFLCCREAANRIKQGGGGRIILLSSSTVATMKPNAGAYAASKAAVETTVKILAKELRETRITANCIAPGPTATDMFLAMPKEIIKRAIEDCPHGRLAETYDIDRVVGFLASDASEWINGQVIGVNGGIV
ncbi:NADPH-dependent aldehyde reductase-like protein, chloroplastic [Punica granatum]|uniref:NADPH-dependent aldehyde reductase-like protein, chloroplastic n=1 Tax=Punica granatum TaxID=22663 RepID=A0A218X278_PUNGR|nr:NADPH-dependent aldehyde reductase-like protein, chloroplastic [Punica granatum]OWM78806.1 hypothetical protein CDL15_Pgr002977 [Punica granatum]